MKKSGVSDEAEENKSVMKDSNKNLFSYEEQRARSKQLVLKFYFLMNKMPCKIS